MDIAVELFGKRMLSAGLLVALQQNVMVCLYEKHLHINVTALLQLLP